MTISAGDNLSSDDPFYTVVGNNIQGSYIPATAGLQNGGSTSSSVMSVTSGGIVINLILDAAAQAAPTSFKNGLQQAVAILAANITDKITVNINIDYSGTGGGASAGPDSGYYENYSWVHSQLVNSASAGDTTFNSLPGGTTIQGQSNVAVWNAQLKLWGVIGANDTTTDDASAYFSTDINSNLLVGVALHELTHAMGRVPYGSAPDVFDFYRFTSPGVRLFSGAQTAPAAYFSLDGGNTKLADYGQSSDPSDFLNSGVQGANDPFNEYYTSSSLQQLTAIDLKQLGALGFHVASATNSPVNSPIDVSISQSALVADFNGDGKMDLLQVYGNNGDAYVNQSTGSNLGGWTHWGTGLTPSDQAVDLNGDHKADLVQFWNGFNYVALSTGSGFGPWQQWGQGGGTTSDQFADVNGDSKNDLMQVWHGNVYASLSTGTNLTNWQQWGSGATAGDRFVDVTGDGKADIVQIRSDGTVFVGASTGSNFGTWQQWTNGATSGDRLVDTQGDGKADIVQFWNGNIYVAQSTGTSFDAWHLWTTGATSGDRLVDVTGNGKLDLVQIWNGNVYVAPNTGTGFGPWHLWATGAQATDKLVDMNGDGKMDLLDIKNGNAYVALSTGSGFGPWTTWASPNGASQLAANTPSADATRSIDENLSPAHIGTASMPGVHNTSGPEVPHVDQALLATLHVADFGIL